MFSDEVLEKEILYYINGKVAIIQFNHPENLNALSFEHYQYLARLLEKANSEPSTVLTLILGTGKYFSAGADFERNPAFDHTSKSEREAREYWLSRFLANNTYFTSAIYSHEKILVCGLNGSVIGLTAALTALSDLIYCKNDKFFMLLPFANLSLVTEAAAATTLFHRLGLSKANEALLLSKPIRGQELVKVGFINKNYNMDDVDEFNKTLIQDLNNSVEHLDSRSLKEIKQLVQKNWNKQLVETNFNEGTMGLKRFEEGAPQSRFRALKLKQIKHKL